MLWLYIDKSRLQGILQSFNCNYPKNFLLWEFSISIQKMVSYDFCLCSKTKPRLKEQTPRHSSFSNGIICGPHRGSFAVQIWGSSAALYSVVSLGTYGITQKKKNHYNFASLSCENSQSYFYAKTWVCMVAPAVWLTGALRGFSLIRYLMRLIYIFKT